MSAGAAASAPHTRAADPSRSRIDAAAGILAALAEAQRPLILAGRSSAMAAISRCSRASGTATGVPVVPMESPRGINDPRLGAFAEVLRQADLIVLLGKAPTSPCGSATRRSSMPPAASSSSTPTQP